MKHTLALSFAFLLTLITPALAPASQSVAEMISNAPGTAILTLGGIYVQRIDGSALPQWTSPLMSFGQPVTGGLMVPDGAGGVLVTWSVDGVDGIDIFAQRVDASGTALWPGNGIVIADKPYDEWIDGIVSDGVGGAIFIWENVQPGPGIISAQRVNASGTRLWSVDGILVSGDAPGGINLASSNAWAVSDGAGGAIVAWTGRYASETDGFAQRINASGAKQWGLSGQLIEALPGDQFLTDIASDDAGGAIVTWGQAGSDGNQDIYAQRLSPDGQSMWNPVAVSTLTGNQNITGVLPDGAGGAFITWDGKSRNWLQRISASGVLLYAGNGAMTSKYESFGYTNARYGTNLTPDGAGGVIVAWTDLRNSATYTDVYAQRFDGVGVPLWAKWGVPVCRENGHQENPQLVSDGYGGAFIAWWDYRNGDPAMAQRISANGVLTLPTAVGDIRTPSLVVSEAHPNPFADQASLDVVHRDALPVTAEMFDVAGRRVRTLTISHSGAGLAQIVIDGRDKNAHLLPSGVYFCRVHAGAETVTKKLVIAR